MLRKRLTQNVVANVFAQFVTAMVQLGTVPIFLYFWSKELYGEWLILFSVPGYLALADVGIPSVAANEASMQMANGRTEDAKRSIHTAFGLLNLIAMVLLVANIAALSVPWDSILGLSLGSRATNLCVFLLGIYTILGFYCSLATAIYRAAARTPRSTYIASFSRLLEVVATCWAIAYANSIPLLVSALLLVRVLTAAVMILDAGLICPDLRLGLSHFSWTELRRTLHPAFLYMAFPLGNALYFQSLTILVGTTLGPAIVVAFNTTRALTRAIVQVVMVVKYSILPEFSYLIGQGDLGRARRLYGLSFEVTAFLSIGMSFVLYACGAWIMGMWTHGRVSVHPGLLALFLLSAVLNSLWNISSVLLIGCNRHGRLAVVYVAATLCTLGLAFFLITRFKIFGVAWSMIFCEAILLPFALAAAARLLDMSLRSFLAQTLIMRCTRSLVASEIRQRF